MLRRCDSSLRANVAIIGGILRVVAPFRDTSASLRFMVPASRMTLDATIVGTTRLTGLQVVCKASGDSQSIVLTSRQESLAGRKPEWRRRKSSPSMLLSTGFGPPPPLIGQRPPIIASAALSTHEVAITPMKPRKLQASSVQKLTPQRYPPPISPVISALPPAYPHAISPEPDTLPVYFDTAKQRDLSNSRYSIIIYDYDYRMLATYSLFRLIWRPRHLPNSGIIGKRFQ
jgi:hypothetical protein